MRFLASAGKADFIGFYDNRSFVETVSAVNGDEGIVRILGGRNLSGCVFTGTASAVTLSYEVSVCYLFREGVHAIVAHAHRNYGCIKFAVGFHETGKADNLAVAEEVLGDTFTGGCIARMYIQIIELEIFGKIALGVFFLRAVVGGAGDDIVAPCTVCRDTVESVFACFFYLSGCGIQGVRSSGSCVSVIVLQPEEVLLAVEYPIGRTDGFGTVAQYRHGTFVERFAGDEISAFVGLGCNDVFACTRSCGAAITVTSVGSCVVITA